jgi:hypothetical protein
LPRIPALVQKVVPSRIESSPSIGVILETRGSTTNQLIAGIPTIGRNAVVQNISVGVGSDRRSVPVSQLIGNVVGCRAHGLRKARRGKTAAHLGAAAGSIVLVGETADRTRTELIAHGVDVRVVIVAVGQHDSVRQSQGIAPVRIVVADERARASLRDFIQAACVVEVVIHCRLAGYGRSLQAAVVVVLVCDAAQRRGF